MVEIDVADIRQMYEQTIVMKGKRPVYITRVGDNGDVRYTDLISNRQGVEEFSLKTFTPPASRRLGMINVGGSVVYASRIPIRRYKMGFHHENLGIKHLDVKYPDGRDNTLMRVRNMECPELAQAILNEYPSLQEAIATVNKFGGAVAFDKQFAVDASFRIFYKTKMVGKVPAKAVKCADIVFDKGNEHLSFLLDGNHEKAIRAA